MKKHLTFALLLLLGASYRATAQPTSPYVESGTLTVNNSGFKAASIRTAALARPTPMHVQDGAINQTFATRFVVAKNNVSGGNKTWADANGFTSGANALLTGAVVSSPPTGCNAYSEPGAPAGQWRLPTQREMILLSLVKTELASQNQGLAGLSGTYWCATQSTATTAWSFNFASTGMAVKSKTTQYSVRCIRDL